MGWTTTEDLDAYEAAAGDYVRTEPAAHTILLTIAATVRQSPGRFGDETPRFGWWRDGDGGEVAGAYAHTPPYPPVLSRMPDRAAVELARVLRDQGSPVTGVNAGRPAAETFGAAWAELTGDEVTVAEDHRLYRLGELVPPDPMPEGRARVADESDRELLVKWIAAFNKDVGSEGTAAPERAVDSRLGYGGLTLWERDGEPVALCGITRTVAGMARVAPVYTPPELRGRGYAGAATAAVSQAALDRGVEQVLLFTDLDNPTSNALYQRLGYRPVEDHVNLAFTPLA
ncbi:GNAT family N-acetyltransferase [Streptomyces sp. A7024]|uniref:GNAT family N-acetyltransferase n=1 Tax=Streptomyces coryli TaxID=1128680 RepID=A0A6G4TT78_9ACTN|nr:GNAT family N-acetyltransferase [Streptomyces coryli]NGN62308.1 GNAT family N-acetyltransferase [Streptomyces coryli]